MPRLLWTQDNSFRPVVKYLVEHQMLLSFRFQCLSTAATVRSQKRHVTVVPWSASGGMGRVLAETGRLPLPPVAGAPFEGPSA